MKTHRFFVTALLALLPLVTARAASRPAPVITDPRMQVNFFEPDKFTDVKQSEMGSDRERSDLLGRVRDYLVEQAKYYVPQGQTLEITFTDFDMAGDFEPWRGPQMSEVRIVKEIYPPSAKFAFRLVDAEGNVLKQGKRELRDTSFMMTLIMGDKSDTLRHEKAMLEDWLRKEIGRIKK